jgi:alternate signal-mediated exported protein
MEQQEMQNSIKAALAAVAGGTLLLGGAGSLAFWTDSTSAGGGSFASGTLDLGTPDCGDGWTLEGVAYTTQLLVPGDVLTQECSFSVSASGEHLGATLDVESPDWSATTGLTGELDVDATYAKGATPISSFPVAVADADTITATVTVTFDGTDATNGSKALTAALDAITVTATQSHVA